MAISSKIYLDLPSRRGIGGGKEIDVTNIIDDLQDLANRFGVCRDQRIVHDAIAEILQLRKLASPDWFYPADDMDVTSFSVNEVIYNYYDLAPGKHVVEVECAAHLPSIWCAVHVLTDEEMEAIETDDREDFTEHASEVEARAGIGHG
jgi:hypothetical protein